VPLVRADLAAGVIVSTALAVDTLSITIMEAIDNLTVVVIPDAMDAGLGDALFYGKHRGRGSAIAYPFAFLANRYLIARGKGHALMHEHHAHLSQSDPRSEVRARLRCIQRSSRSASIPTSTSGRSRWPGTESRSRSASSSERCSPDARRERATSTPIRSNEVILGAAIFAVMWLMRDRARRDGELAWLVLGLFAFGRFFEFFARSDSADLALGLDNAQWTSVACFWSLSSAGD
jgi:hypothetical protein